MATEARICDNCSVGIQSADACAGACRRNTWMLTFAYVRTTGRSGNVTEHSSHLGPPPDWTTDSMRFQTVSKPEGDGRKGQLT